MLAGKIKSVHKKWLKSNDVDEPEEVQSESDGGDETDAADQPDDDDDEVQSESEEDVALVSLTDRSDPVPAALGELQDDEPLLPGSVLAAKPSPVNSKPAAGKIKKGASKELSQPEATSSKKNPAADAAPPHASAAEAEQPQLRKSSKKKKRSRASREEDVDEVGSSAAPVRKAPRLALSIQGLLFH